jgi:hypothetical protein
MELIALHKRVIGLDVHQAQITDRHRVSVSPCVVPCLAFRIELI